MNSTNTSAEILVVLPTLGDRLDTLQETLESIESQRDFVSLRLIVVCPEHAHEAIQLAKKFDAFVVSDPSKGISAAINIGIEQRKNEEFYAWMGDDDLFRPRGLEKLRRLLTSDKEAIVAYGGCDYIDSQGNVLATSNAGKLAQFLLPWGPDLIPHPGSMIRLDALQLIGNFDTKLKFAMDLDAFLKLRKIGKFVYTREVVSAFRWHAESLTVANRGLSSAESEAVKFKHLGPIARSFSWLWVRPIRWASAIASQRVSAQVRRF